MQWLILLLAVYAAATMQAAFDSVLCVGIVVPDWFVLTALLFVLTVRRSHPLLVGMIVGITADLSAVGPLGVSTALLALTTGTVAHLRRKLHIEHPIIQIPLIAIATTLYTLSIIAVSTIGPSSTPNTAMSLLGAIGVGGYTAALALPVLLIIAWTREARPLNSIRSVGSALRA